jgi:hypothetical protein
MRNLILVVAVLVVLGAPFRAQTRDAAAILADLRQALGGAAVLDGINSFSVRGTLRQNRGGRSRSLSLELSVVLPDHYLEVRRDWQSGGPMPVDITYYRGFRGDTLIRRTDANIPFPPDPGPNTPAAIAQRELAITLKNKQEFARLSLVLFGRAFSGYPLQFDFLGAAQLDGRPIEVIEATAADGYKMRLSVDATTHLPAMISYLAEEPVLVSTSSTVTMRGDQVVSRSDGPMPFVPSTAGLPKVEQSIVPSEFKLQDGVNWPRRLKEFVAGKVVRDVDFGKFRINPTINLKRFDVGR